MTEFLFADNMRKDYFLSRDYLESLDKEKLDRLVSLSKALNVLANKQDQKTVLKLIIETIDSLLVIVTQGIEATYLKGREICASKEMSDRDFFKSISASVRERNVIREAEYQLGTIRGYALSALNDEGDASTSSTPDFKEKHQAMCIGVWVEYVRNAFMKDTWKTDIDEAIQFQVQVTMLERLIAEYRFNVFKLSDQDKSDCEH